MSNAYIEPWFAETEKVAFRVNNNLMLPFEIEDWSRVVKDVEPMRDLLKAKLIGPLDGSHFNRSIATRTTTGKFGTRFYIQFNRAFDPAALNLFFFWPDRWPTKGVYPYDKAYANTFATIPKSDLAAEIARLPGGSAYSIRQVYVDSPSQYPPSEWMTTKSTSRVELKPGDAISYLAEPSKFGSGTSYATVDDYMRASMLSNVGDTDTAAMVHVPGFLEGAPSNAKLMPSSRVTYGGRPAELVQAELCGQIGIHASSKPMLGEGFACEGFVSLSKRAHGVHCFVNGLRFTNGVCDRVFFSMTRTALLRTFRRAAEIYKSNKEALAWYTSAINALEGVKPFTAKGFWDPTGAVYKPHDHLYEMHPAIIKALKDGAKRKDIDKQKVSGKRLDWWRDQVKLITSTDIVIETSGELRDGFSKTLYYLKDQAGFKLYAVNKLDSTPLTDAEVTDLGYFRIGEDSVVEAAKALLVTPEEVIERLEDAYDVSIGRQSDVEDRVQAGASVANMPGEIDDWGTTWMKHSVVGPTLIDLCRSGLKLALQSNDVKDFVRELNVPR